MSETWLKSTASDLGRGIGAGEIDPVALTDTYLAAIDAHPLRDRIYAHVTHDRARAEARAAAARARIGRRLSLLDGVPISWKDLFETAGTPTEAGTAYLKGNTPEHDAVVLQNATRAGLVCLGKTHMSELAYSGLGYNPVTATPPCVNDPSAAPGGSSSGAATSVAFDLAACGIGSDTGGSVRIPSAWNDLVGLKTTHGHLSLEGVVPLCLTFDTVGPLARSVEDAVRVTAAMLGKGAPDLTGASLAGRRFLVLENIALEDLEDAPRAGFDRALAALVAAGATLEPRTLPSVEAAMPLAGPVFTVDAYSLWKDVIEADPSLMFPQILHRFRAGDAVSGVTYRQAWIALESLRAKYLEETAGFDAVLLPSSPNLPPNVERLANDEDYYVQANMLTLRNTRIANLMGLCALSIPTGVPSTGLMMMGRPLGEDALLRLGIAAEAAIGA